MSTQKAVKCKICGKKYVSKQALIDHIDKSHAANIPEGWNAARYENFLRTGKTEGYCVYCHKVTGWNDATGKYNRMCGSEKCKKIARDKANKNYIGLHGKPYSINDPEQQKKMVYGRKNSGKYVFEGEDGKKYVAMYDSSYGRDFFEMIDTLLSWDGSDIIAPSPHTYWYEYEGKKHFYIPDAYSTSLNLEIEFKDGGDNPNTHPKIQAIDKVKEQKKDEVMESLKDQVNYIKICNKDYTGFFAMLSRLKQKDVCPLPKWEGKLESITESYLSQELDWGTCFGWYHLEEEAKKHPGGWDDEQYFKDLNWAIRQELSHLSLHQKQGSVTRYVYTLGKEYRAVLLGTITIKWYDYWDHVDPQYEYFWESYEEVNLDDIDTDKNPVLESVSKTNRLDIILSPSFLKRQYQLRNPLLNYTDLMNSYRKKLFHENLNVHEWQNLYNELICVRDYLKKVVNGQSDEDKRMNYEAKKALKQTEAFIQYMEEKNSAMESVVKPIVESSMTRGTSFHAIGINDPLAKKYIDKTTTKEHFDTLKRTNIGTILVDNDTDDIIGHVFVDTTKDKGFISNLWVAPKYRNHGFGSRLLNAAISDGGIDLTVKKTNKIALNMYEKHGFIKIRFKNCDDNPYYWMKLGNKLTKGDTILTESVVAMESKKIFEPGDFAEYAEFTDLDAARRPIGESVSPDKIPIYIIAYRYRSPFGAMVRMKTHSDYNHVAIALSEDFEHAYTFSRRTDIDNCKMGFTEEPLSYMVSTDKKTVIKVLRVYVSKRSYAKLESIIAEYTAHKNETKFNWGGMINFVHQNGIDNDELNDMSMVCSTFVDYILKESGVDLTKKPNSNLVTPEDLASSDSHNNNVTVVYQGLGQNYDANSIQESLDLYINSSNMEDDIMEGTIYNQKGLNDIIGFNAQTNVMEYIIPNDGNIIYKVTSDDFVNHYRLLTPNEFKKWNGGVCWDYVVYEADYFKKHFNNVKFETYFHCFIDGKTNPTHTFLLFYLNNKVYWFESSWKSHVGVWEFTSKDIALSYIVKELYKDLDHKPDKQVTIIYDALSPKMTGMSCVEYMKYMNSQKEIHYKTISNPKPLNYYRGEEAFDINQYATQESSSSISVDESTSIEAMKDDTKYYPVFIFLSYTGTNTAKLIKAFTHDPYAHSSLSFDTELTHMISFNGNGMVDENIFDSVYKKNASKIRYSLYVYMATADEYDAMRGFVDELLGKRSKLKYNILGLTNFIFGRGSEREDKFFCSEFVASVISAGNDKIFNKKPYMTSPYMLAKNKNFVFIKTGILKNYDSKIIDKIVAEKLEEGGFTNVTFK